MNQLTLAEITQHVFFSVWPNDISECRIFAMLNCLEGKLNYFCMEVECFSVRLDVLS